MLPLAGKGDSYTRFLRTILHRTSLLRLSSYFSTAYSGSSSRETAVNAENLGPPPIRVALTGSAGRGVFATRNISSGELIHTANPVVSHPSLAKVHSVCYLCLKRLPNSGAELRAAQSVSYCSDECNERSKAFYEVEDKADWSDFDEYCYTQGLKYPMLVKRLVCMVISGAASADCLDILQPAHLSSGIISEIKKGFDLLRNALVKAGIGSEQIAFLSEHWYIDLLARIRINAFRVELAGSYEDLLSLASASVDAEAAVGNAVYMLPSFYNHDCDPNAHIIWLENASARLKALRNIDSGEELRICYIDASLDCDARQGILSQGFGFRCNCGRCLSGD